MSSIFSRSLWVHFSFHFTVSGTFFEWKIAMSFFERNQHKMLYSDNKSLFLKTQTVTHVTVAPGHMNTLLNWTPVCSSSGSQRTRQVGMSHPQLPPSLPLSINFVWCTSAFTPFWENPQSSVVLGEYEEVSKKIGSAARAMVGQWETSKIICSNLTSFVMFYGFLCHLFSFSLNCAVLLHTII